MQNTTTRHRRRFVSFLSLAVTLLGCNNDPEIVEEPQPDPVKPYLTVQEELPPFGAEASAAELRFSTNEAWSIEAVAADDSSDDWFGIEPEQGEAGEDIAVAVHVGENPLYVGRGFQLTIRTASLEETVGISQLKRNAIIAGSNRYELSDEAQSLSIEIQANVDYEVAIAEGGEWIAAVEESRAENGLTSREHRFSVAANTEPQERTAIIVFRDTDSELSDEVAVVQAAWIDPNPERSALRAIYREAGGEGWTRSDNWCSDRPLGEWYGVATDEEGHVVELRLPHNNLCGSLAHEVANLSHLRVIDLSYNELDCYLVYELPDSYVILSDLDHLTELEEIDLSHNRLRSEYGSTLALENMPRLRRVDLSYNQLECWASSKFWGPLFENGRTVDLIFNGNQMYGDIDEFIQNHPDWDRLALQLVRQNYPYGAALEYTKDIHVPDFTFTDLRTGAQQSIGSVCSENRLTMILSWDPTSEASIRFAETSVHRYHTLYGGQGFAVVAIVPEGEKYRQAAEQYLSEHDVAWPVVADYADAEGRRIILHVEPYPNYLLFDGEGKLVDDVHNNRAYYSGYPGDMAMFDLGGDRFQYANYMNGFCFDAFGDCTYESSDYSMDKQIELLQHATRGNGIDIVLIGEAFTDIDIETGFYRDAMVCAMEEFFNIEPTKSYREYFNVYMVYAVSKKRQIGIWGYDCALWTERVDYDTGLRGDTYMVDQYVDVVPGSGKKFPTVIVNSDDGRGRVTYFESSTDTYPYVGFPCDDRAYLRYFLHHESIGHGFGLLGDEYHHPGAGLITASEKNRILSYHRSGSFLNLSLTDDPEAVPWAHLIGHPRFPKVGVYEGGLGYEFGVWHSYYDGDSLMGMGGDFNACCRELIVKRILTLAGEEYTFEKFLERDVLSTKTTSNTPHFYPEIKYEHHPPVFLDEK